MCRCILTPLQKGSVFDVLTCRIAYGSRISTCVTLKFTERTKYFETVTLPHVRIKKKGYCTSRYSIQSVKEEKTPERRKFQSMISIKKFCYVFFRYITSYLFNLL